MSQKSAVLLALAYLLSSVLSWLGATFGVWPISWQQLGSGSSVLFAALLGASGFALRSLGRPLTPGRTQQGSASELGSPSFIGPFQQFWATRTKSELHVVLMCGVAFWNWCGAVLLTSPSLLEALPALLTLFCFELLAWKRMAPLLPILTSHPRIVALSAKLTSWFGSRAKENFGAEATSHALETELDPSPACDTGEMSEAGRPERTILDRGIQCGERSVEGSARVAFEPDQRLAEFVVSFCPAFDVEPSLEFEPSDADFEVRLGRISPQGAQLLIRRQNMISDEVEVAWYASEGEEQPITSEILP